MLMACGGEEPSPDHADRTARTASPLDSAVSPTTDPDTAPPASPSSRPDPRDSSVARPGAGPGWSGGAWRAEPADLVTVTAVRAAAHEGYDRFVLELEGPTAPGYDVVWLDRAPTRCGSGRPVDVEAPHVLRIRLPRARAHTEEGVPTPGRRELRPELPSLRSAVLTCDFEGQVEWILGVERRVPVRVLALDAPGRLVVDLAHRPEP